MAVKGVAIIKVPVARLMSMIELLHIWSTVHRSYIVLDVRLTFKDQSGSIGRSLSMIDIARDECMWSAVGTKKEGKMRSDGCLKRKD